MSLISCPECGKNISDSAIVCPSCGFSIKEHLEEVAYNEEVNRLMSQIIPCDFETPAPHMRVCIKCCAHEWTLLNGSVRRVCKCAFNGRLYPTIEIDLHDNGEDVGKAEWNLYTRLYLIEARQIGDKESDEYNATKKEFEEYIAFSEKWARDLGRPDYVVTPEKPNRELREDRIEAERKQFLIEAINHHPTPSIPTCPKCGSTAITTGARGVNWVFGLVGASKTVNRCGNCGHTWAPGK